MIPIGTDRRLKHTPWVNYALVAANVFDFIFLQRTRSDLPALRIYLLHPDNPELHQFISCMFMHGNWAHLIGNMIFLWVFGNAVNDRLGHVGYVAFYLAGGIFAGIGYVLLSGTAPVLGASGAISAVTGAFLVLFPRVRVMVLLLLFYLLVPIEVSSLFFLLLQFGWNLYASLVQPGGGIAYAAHTTGYVYGMAISAFLLGSKILPREPYDLINLINSWRRRWGYRQAEVGGYTPFGPARRPPVRVGSARKWVRSKTIASEVPQTPQAMEMALRKQIATDHARGDLASAAKGYLQLLQIAPDPILPLNQQLDIANYLMSSFQYAQAAKAYEQFEKYYGDYQYIGDIRLMLGLIYSRYLHQDERAEMYLSRAIPDLLDQNKVELAESELEQVRSRLGR